MVSRENKYILKNVQVVNLLINKISDIVIALIANNFEKSTSSRHASSDWSSSGDNKPSLSFAPTFQNSPDPTQTNDMQILISLVPLLVSQSMTIIIQTNYWPTGFTQCKCLGWLVHIYKQEWQSKCNRFEPWPLTHVVKFYSVCKSCYRSIFSSFWNRKLETLL